MSARIDLTGKKFGAWIVIAYGGMNENDHSTWLCRCACGTVRRVVAQPLRDGKTLSCGCQKPEAIAVARTTHGKSETYKWRPEFRAWMSMRRRCSPGNKGMRALYAERGIKVCEQWDKSFGQFYRDMGPIPVPGYTLDRIDNDGHYEPGNCRWADAQTQAQNRRTSRRAA